jgi:phage terminase large subunit-like protein
MLFELARQYAEDVINGKEITTKEVIIQCKWFMRDLERQYQEDYPYYFDMDEILKIEGILKLLNFATGIDVVGSSIMDKIVGFQAFFFCNVFGFRFKSNPRKFKHSDVTLFICRKNSKTFIASICLLILLLTEDDYSEYYSVSIDRDLAAEVKKALSQIIESSPKIEKYFTIPKALNGKIVCKLTKSFYQARTAQPNSNNSIRPSGYIADEIGAFRDYSNINALRSGMLNTRNAVRFNLTTAYAEDQSIMLEELDYLKKVFNGFIQDDRMFALLFYSDPENLWSDIGMYQANPLRIENNYNEIRQAREKAINKPKEREEFLTKHCNFFLPSSSGEAYIDVEDLRKCKIDSFDWRNRYVYIGIDLAQTTDNCAVSMICEEDLVLYAESFSFVPTDRIEEKNRLEKLNYWDFIKSGKCFNCGDNVVDYIAIEDFILDLENRFGVIIMGIAFDRYNCISTANRLERVGNYKLVEVKQHSSHLHAPVKLLREKILMQEFHYTENKLLEINFSNARCTEDTNKNLYLNKKKSHGKIDCVMSLVNGLYLLQQDVIFNPDSDWAIQVI